MGLSGRPAYKIWPTNDGRGNQGHGSWPTHSSATAVHREGGATMDLRMRKGRRADLPIIWPATLQTAWDDLPEDERKGLDRQAWERHFRNKLEVGEGNGRARHVYEKLGFIAERRYMGKPLP